MSEAHELQMGDRQLNESANDGHISSTNRTTSAAPASREDRRSLPRRRVERLAYIRFDKDNGGILLDIGEGGLKFHGIASSLEGEFCIVKFMLPGSGRTIEVRGQIAWSNKSRKGGGVRFVDIPEEVRQQIREWMAQENVPLISTRPAAKPIVSKPPQFLTRERVKAGMTSLPLSPPVMPPLSSAPAVPIVPVVAVAPVPVAQVRGEDRAAATPLPTEIIAPAAKISDAVVASAKVEVPPASVLPPVLEPNLVSEPQKVVEVAHAAAPGLVAQDARTAEPPKTLTDTFRGITTPAAAQLPVQASEQPQKSSDWYHPATSPRSESFLSVDLAASKYVRPKRSSRVAQVAGVAAFVCVAAAAAVVVTPRTPALIASFRGISLASTSAPVSAAASDAVAGQDFTVDAVDSANRHWTLRNGRVDDSTVASLGSASNEASNTVPNHVASNVPSNVPNNVPNNVPGDVTLDAAGDRASKLPGSISAAAAQPVEAGRIVPAESRIKPLVTPPQHLDLRPPKTRHVVASSSGLEAPAVAENAPSANLLESRSLAPLAPSLPAPPLPAPPPVAPSVPAPATVATASVNKSAIRPAVLIHSVRAVYPRDISPGKSGSSVRVSAVIDKEGVPESLTMVGGDPTLLDAAFAAVREYRYDPALRNGEPVESTVVIAVNFQQVK